MNEIVTRRIKPSFLGIGTKMGTRALITPQGPVRGKDDILMAVRAVPYGTTRMVTVWITGSPAMTYDRV